MNDNIRIGQHKLTQVTCSNCGRIFEAWVIGGRILWSDCEICRHELGSECEISRHGLESDASKLCCRCGYVVAVPRWTLRPANTPSATDSLPDIAISEKTHRELLEKSLEESKEIWERLANIEKSLGSLKT